MTPPTPFKFEFGAGANFGFESGVSGQAGPAYPSAQQQQIEDLEVENALLQNKLEAALVRASQADDALEQIRLLGIERDTAKEAEVNARNDLTRLAGEWQSLTRDKPTMDDDYERIIDLQKEVEDLTKTNKGLRDELAKAIHDLSTSNSSFDNATKERNSYKEQVEQQRAATEKLRTEAEHYKKNAEDSDATLSQAYARHEQLQGLRLAADEAKLRAEEEKKDWEQQFRDLHQQWQESQTEVEQLEEQQKQSEQLEAIIRNLETDIEELQSLVADHERTVIVKDERIAHLENQFQKERQRNLNAADAAAAAAATSPVDEAPPSFSSLGDTLQDELDAASEDYDHLEYEHLDLSDITEIASIEPAGRAPRPDCTIDVNEAASISPISATVPELALAVTEAGSVTPVERKIYTTTAGAQTDAPALAAELLHDAIFAISPIAPVEITTTTISTQTEAPELTSNVIDAASIAVVPIDAFRVEHSTVGVQTEHLELTTNVVDTAFIGVSPIEAKPQPLTSCIIESATLAISPVDTERKPMSSFGGVETIFAEEPVDTLLPKMLTADTAAQTTETTPEPAVPSVAPVQITPKRNRIGLLQAILPFVALLLAISCLHLYIQLDSWRYANGVGYTYSNSGRTGAFGNGRHLFGFIPIAMDIGDSWWEEQIARYMSTAIKSFENWAGIDYRPLY